MPDAKQRRLLIITNDNGLTKALKGILEVIPELAATLHEDTRANGAARCQSEDWDLVFAEDACLEDQALQTALASTSRPAVILVAGADYDKSACPQFQAGLIDEVLFRRNLTLNEVRQAISEAVPKRRKKQIDRKLQLAREEAERAQDQLAEAHTMLDRWSVELEVANSRLKDVDDMKSVFLNQVSHEIRSPLAAISSAAQIIRKHHSSDPTVITRFSDTILSEGDKLTSLVSGLVDLARLDAGAVDWNDADILPIIVLEDAAASVEVLAEENSVQTRIDIDETAGLCCADPDRLTQVLTTLATNACEAAPEGGLVILRAERENDQVLFQVIDDGPGIAADQQALLFDRYRQWVETPVRGAGSGSGLGLSIARKIVEHYGGQIWLDSEVGAGTTFTFTIPAAGEAVAPAKKSGTVPPKSPAVPVSVLLITKDLEVTRRVDARELSPGVDVQVAATAPEAYAALSNRNADVAVVSDDLALELGEDFLQGLQERGVSDLLLYSDEHGFVDVGVFDSAERILTDLERVTKVGEKILVCEDDDEYRALMSYQLEDIGYDVLEAANGPEALEMFEQKQPAAVILDLLMPGMDGLAVLEQMKIVSPEVPVLILTAMDDRAVAVTAMELGAFGVFSKDGGQPERPRAAVTAAKQILAPTLTAGTGAAPA